MPFRKGHKINLGKKHSQATKDKMSTAKLGKKCKPFTQLHRDNIGAAGLGRKLSIKTRLKISESHKGEKSYLWRGGITSENKRIRKSVEYKHWRESVFARDNWTCRKYKIKGSKLHPHHVKGFAQYPELRFVIDNGVTLSEKAHMEFHKLYGYANNTKEQLEEFIN